MKRDEFYQRIFERLDNYSMEEKKKIREYYEELICDGIEAGVSEDEVIGSLESPEHIAEGLRSEYAGANNKGRTENREIHRQWNGHYQSVQPVTRLNVGARDRGLNIQKSVDDKVHILYEPQDMDEIVCSEKDGVFYFHQSTRRILSFFQIGFIKNFTIVVQVPDSVEILEVSSKNGGIQLENIQPSKIIDAKTTNSGITARNLETEEITMSTSNARIECQDTKSRDSTFRTSNGKIKLSRVEAAHHLTAASSNAAIAIDMIRADMIDLQSSNGAIKGIIDGDAYEYAIRSKTSNGKNSLPSSFHSDQEKKLFVSTSNSSIKVEFSRGN